MKKKLFDIFRLLRPRQWIKNLAIFAAITFTGHLFDWPIMTKVLIGFFVFCGLSSSIYIINDIFDIDKDRLHPFKRFRPLAHGDVSIFTGIAIAIFLTFVSLLFSFSVSPAFFILMIVYLLLQLGYSMTLKNIAILDIIVLAAGYILRVYGGEAASGLHISVWLLLTTISLSLFLAVGKRRSELTLVSRHTGPNIKQTRKSLSQYSEKILDVYASTFATSTFISYALFTFLENPVGFKLSLGILMPDFLPVYFQRKWLMITIIPVVYGLMRYIQDIYEKHEGESPERVLLSDKPLLAIVTVWIILVVGIIYFVGS
ncbi:MAG: decaprenyl-phosphate phosphoribosyltransferase [Candidatus Levybacteria bacterium]|nr:decaprenyl-phosphate phosphoribosyltransferase [Candidatus Levybacteria bacterium]